MSIRSSGAALAVIALAFTAPVAFALNNRSAVSVNGVDTNPCTPASPCRSFSFAITQTNPGGEIIALDTAGYGPFVIDRVITVSGAPGMHAAITTTTGDGIQVNVGTSTNDRVTIRNLVLIGAGGTNGINQLAASQLRVIGCLIRGYSANGIFQQADSGSLSVDRTDILDNTAATGVSAIGGLTIALTVVNNSLIEGNNVGVHAGSNSRVVVANSTITGSLRGVESVSTTGSALLSSLVLENNVIAHNTTGIFATASGGNNVARVTISQNVVAFNTFGVSTTGGAVDSFTNNRFTANGSDGGPFGSVAFQ